MSIKVISYVWDHSKQKGSALLMLLAIADNANEQGEAFPAVPTLAKKTRMTKRNAQMLLTKLEEAKELVIQERDGTSNLYVIPVPWRPQAAKSKHIQRGVKRSSSVRGVKWASRGGEAGFTPGVKRASREGVKRVSPKPSLEPSFKPFIKPFARKRAEAKKQNPIFNAVATYIFETDPAQVNGDGGRIGPIAAWLAGTSDGMKRGRTKEVVGFISAPAETKHIQRFAADYKREHPNTNYPLDFIKFVEAWRKWATQQQAAQKRKAAPAPAAQPPPTPEEQAAVDEIRRTVRPAWEKDKQPS